MQSLTAAVKFAPRNAVTAGGLTAAQVRDVLKARGVVFAVTADDFAVRARGQSKDDAYHTDDLDDAYATGLELAA